MHSKTVELQQCEDSGDLFIELEPSIVDHLGWDEGDTISWEDNYDGSWTLKKKETRDWYDFFLPDAPLYEDTEETEEIEMTETKSDIFELEQSLMRCWGVVEDLRSVYNAEGIYNDEDRMQNALLGLITLYDIKFDECFKQFEMMCKEYWELKKK